MAEREIEFLREGLRRHVKTLAVDIGPRTPFNGDSLERAAAYIQSAFEKLGLTVTEQPYQYYVMPLCTPLHRFHSRGAHAALPGARRLCP